jgi:hypothetical protein
MAREASRDHAVLSRGFEVDVGRASFEALLGKAPQDDGAFDATTEAVMVRAAGGGVSNYALPLMQAR